MKFHILIYGCQMNYSDSARIKTVLENIGFIYTDNIKNSDIVIFDSCSVRQKSEDKITGKLKSIPKDKKIRITGCMAQHYLKSYLYGKIKHGNFQGFLSTDNPEIIGKIDNVKDIIKTKKNTSNLLMINHSFNPLYKKLNNSFPQIELMFRVDDIAFLPMILSNIGYNIPNNIKSFGNYLSILPKFSNQVFFDGAKTAYVPISNGCSHFCSYCIVPFARGLEKFRPFDEIIEEVKFHLSNGVQEILLLGQIVNKHPEFIKILKNILKLKGLKRLRYTSPYPTLYNEEVFKLHENEILLCPHIHMPFQSGSDEILNKMNRGYTLNIAKDFIDKVYSLKRRISLTTDIIVGFPTESDFDFAQTVSLVDYGKFDMIFIGLYSQRPMTLAAKKYPDDVDIETKKERREILNDMLNTISLENNKKEIGLIKDIMITGYNGDSKIGYDERMKNVIIKLNKTKNDIGTFKKVKITKAESLKIFGELL